MISSGKRSKARCTKGFFSLCDFIVAVAGSVVMDLVRDA
jgi:hypothetical protein